MTHSNAAYSKPKLNWEEAKVFTDGPDAVIVKKLPLFNPKYSISIGTMKDGRFAPYTSPNATVEHGVVKFTSVVPTLSRLIEQAEVFICEEMQRQADARIEMQQARELRSMEQRKHGPESKIPPRVGKTARDREKPPGKKTNDPTLSQRAKGSSGGGNKGGKK